MRIYRTRAASLAFIPLVLAACAEEPAGQEETTITTTSPADTGSTSDDPTATDTTESAGSESGAVDIQPCGGSRLIDDLEDGDGLIASYPEEPRQGAWYTYNDESGGTQIPEAGAEFIPTPEQGADGTLNGAQTSGSGFAEWGAGVGFDLNNPGCPEGEECPVGNEYREVYDASAWKGVRFFAKSNGDPTSPLVVQFKVPTSLETPTEEGGTCVQPDCSDSYFVALTLTSDWQYFEFEFETDLAQGNWGQSFAFDPKQVFGLQWQVAASQGASFDFSVDEICFFD